MDENRNTKFKNVELTNEPSMKLSSISILLIILFTGALAQDEHLRGALEEEGVEDLEEMEEEPTDMMVSCCLAYFSFKWSPLKLPIAISNVLLASVYRIPKTSRRNSLTVPKETCIGAKELTLVVISGTTAAMVSSAERESARESTRDAASMVS